MDTKPDLKRAVAEAGNYLGCYPGLPAAVDVCQLADVYRAPLTLGTIHALWDLANDILAMCGEYTPEELARAARR